MADEIINYDAVPENVDEQVAPENTVTYTAYVGDEPIVTPQETVEVIEEQPKETELEKVDEVVEKVEQEDEFETVELNAELAFKFLKEEKGFTAESLDELLTPKQQKQYAPQLEKFQEYIEKTGNENFNDFLATQKDWSQENEEVRLKEFIKGENPLLSSKEVDFLYNRKYSVEGLDEEDDEELITEKGINIKADLNKADAFLEKRKEEYMIDRGSDAHIPETYREAKAFKESLEQQQQESNLAYNSAREDYVSKTESFYSTNYEGFKIKLGNEEIGFEEVSIKPENVQETKNYQLDVANFNKEFFDESGKLKEEKSAEWFEALYMARNYKTEMNKAYNLGRAKQLELEDKVSKNIQPDNIRDIPNTAPSKTTYTVVKD